MILRLTIYSLLISWLAGFLVATTFIPEQVVDTTSVIHHEYSIAEWIVVSAEKHGVDPVTAIRIADCESKLGTQNHNQQGSSAKGVYQFIDSTWKNYCEGDVLNQNDNIACFMKLYKQHPTWWSCR